MRIKFDLHNGATIAEGNFKGKRIKAVVVCKEPVFDKEFGERLVRQKYKINLKQYKIKKHEQKINALVRLKQWADSLIMDLNKNIEILEDNLNYETDVYFKMLHERFPDEQA